MGSTVSNITELEFVGNTTYTPQHDVKGVGSRILVAYMAGPPAEEGSLPSELRGHAEVLCSLGASWDWECEGDHGAAIEGLVHALKEQPDGLYVLQGFMLGSGEDVEFDVVDCRPLSAEERRWVRANDDFQGVVHLWVKEYRVVPCRHCKHPLEQHDFWMACPRVETDKDQNKSLWLQTWAEDSQDGD